MKRFRISIFRIFLLIVLSFIFRGTLSAQEQNPKKDDWLLEFKNNMTPLTQKSLSESQVTALLKRDINPDHVFTTKTPHEWSISIANWPLTWDIRPFGQDEGVTFNADPSFTLFSRSFLISGSSFKVEVDADGPGKLEVGIQYAANQVMDFIEKVKSDENNHFSYSFTNPEDFIGNIRILIRISGEITIREVRFFVPLHHDISTVCEGTVDDLSPIHALTDYSDRNNLFSADFTVNSIKDGLPVPRKIRLLIPGYASGSVTNFIYTQQNAKYEVTLRSSKCVSKQVEALHRVDDLPLSSETDCLCFVSRMKPIAEFSQPSGSIPVLERSLQDAVSPFSRNVNSAEEKNAEECLARSRTAVSRELLHIQIQDDFLKKAVSDGISVQFRTEWAKRYAELEHLDNGKAWFADSKGSFWALPEQYDITQDAVIPARNIQTVQQFRDLLEKNGVRLIVQLVPSADSIAARKIMEGHSENDYAGLPDAASIHAAAALLDAGIETLPAWDALMNSPAASSSMLFLYPVDNRIFDGAQDILARQAAGYLEKEFKDVFPFKTLDSSAFSRKTMRHMNSISKKFVWPADVSVGAFQAGNAIDCREIMIAGKKFTNNPKSPLLLVGSEVIHSPLPDFAYAAYLSQFNGFIPDVISIRGDTMLENAMYAIYQDPERFLKGKKAVLWPMTLSELCSPAFYNDLRSLDELETIIRTCRTSVKTKLLDYPLNYNRLQIPASKAAIWNEPFKKADFAYCIEEQNRDHVMREIPLPSAVSKARDCYCVLRVLVYYQSDVAITLNGQEKQLCRTQPDDPAWQTCVFRIPAGTEKLKLSIRCSKRDTPIAFRMIELFQ